MKKALVVVDYQKDFVDGALGSADALALEDPLYRRVAEALDGSEVVFFTMDTHGPDYNGTNEGRHIPVPHCIKGTEGWRIFGKLEELSRKAEIFCKDTFGSIALAERLSEGGFDRIELCGVATNICVAVNAALIRSFLPEAEIVIDPKLVASYDRGLGEAALNVMGSFCIDIKNE